MTITAEAPAQTLTEDEITELVEAMIFAAIPEEAHADRIADYQRVGADKMRCYVNFLRGGRYELRGPLVREELAEQARQNMPRGGGSKGGQSSTRNAAKPERKATPPMMDLIRKLAGERDLSMISSYQQGMITRESLVFAEGKALIDALLDAPLKAGQTQRPSSSGGFAGSPKQRALIVKLLDEKMDITGEAAEKVLADLTTWQKVRETIDNLISLVSGKVVRLAAAAPAQAEDGFYGRDGKIYKVQTNLEGTRRYAKVLEKDEEAASGWRFVRAPGMVNRLTTDDKLTTEQAAEFGTLYGVCGICARTLTDEDSIARGIGKICYGKHF